MRLVGTTKPTIAQIKDRTHWNSPNLVPQDPVTLGLCSQTDLDNEVKKAARRLERERREAQKEAIKAGTLLPTEETTAPPAAADDEGFRPTTQIMQPKEDPEAREETPAEEEARMFAKLKELKSDPESGSDEGDEDEAEAEAEAEDVAEVAGDEGKDG
jgi:hypothetical protein